MKLAFTGTQHGLTASQRRAAYSYIETFAPQCIIHGGCIGADDEIDELAATLGIARRVYPSNIESKTVPQRVLLSRRGSRVDIDYPRPPLSRNRIIVRVADKLLACPREKAEVQRSGTWMTIRLGWKRAAVTTAADFVTIIYP